MLGTEGAEQKKGQQASKDAAAAMTSSAVMAANADGPTPTALAQMVEGEIIPRLLLAHRQHARPAQRQNKEPSMKLEVTQFAAQSLDADAYALLASVEAQLALGLDVETLFIDLLAPTARQLGTWWDEDVCDFVDVTMGLWRLQEVVHEISARVPGAAEGRCGERRALFASAPSAQHAFGSLMVEEFFRRSGWSTWSAQNAPRPDIIAQVSTRWFDVIALTVSTEADLDQFPELIASLRAASRNPAVIVMAGGWVFNQNPSLADEVGADCTAPDARAAVQQAERLLAERSPQAERLAGRLAGRQ